MSLFKNKKPVVAPVAPVVPSTNYSALAELTLNSITDGVLLVDERGVIKFANPAAATMAGYDSPENVINLSYDAVLRLENGNGALVATDNSPLAQAFATNSSFTARDYLLISAQGEHRAAITLSLIPTGTVHDNRIITFRDITNELKDEQDKSEFISTASHEMRTPVASIEGYLALALNPQTATIDARARQYLEAAHKSSKHLGDLFRDLLDVTKLDDNRLKVHLVPVDIVATVKEFADAREKDMQKKHLKYSFGTNAPVTNTKQVNQLVYAAVDLSFLQEIIDNLIENAIKYTPEGGEIWVNARGDGDKVVINVTDTGIGVSPDDAAHIFQKFYRVDNSQTRQIGGTGLGLYLVKQRVEAMNGRVWVESAFGDGSTFFVSLPRLTDAEYQKQKIAYDNEQAIKAFSEGKNVATSAMINPVNPTQGQAQSQPRETAPTAPVTSVPAQAPVAPQATEAASPVATVAPSQTAPVAGQAAPVTGQTPNTGQVAQPTGQTFQQPANPAMTTANPAVAAVPQEAPQTTELMPALDTSAVMPENTTQQNAQPPVTNNNPITNQKESI